ncbi:hypothetical protein FB451DRAFT_1187377 [Mycena latifolia]|nr:hypothetical protein FB451DRAFT_1187377 [Mycena latifolia]
MNSGEANQRDIRACAMHKNRAGRLRQKTDGDGAEDLSGLFTRLELWSKSKDRQKISRRRKMKAAHQTECRLAGHVHRKMRKPVRAASGPKAMDWTLPSSEARGTGASGHREQLARVPSIRKIQGWLYRASSFLSSVLPPSHVLDVASSLFFVLSNVHPAEFQCQVWIHVALLIRVQHYREYGQRDSLRYSEDDAPGINRHRSMGEPFTRAGDVLLPPSILHLNRFVRARRPCNLLAAYPGTISSEASTEFFRPSNFKSTGP